MGKKIFFNKNVDEQTSSSVTFTRVISSRPEVEVKFELCNFRGIPVSGYLILQVRSVQLLHKPPYIPMLALRDYYQLLKMEKEQSVCHFYSDNVGIDAVDHFLMVQDADSTTLCNCSTKCVNVGRAFKNMNVQGFLP